MSTPMPSDGAIGRYRRWYQRLLRLYPRPFHERFAEPMAQTFTDLARERTDANRGLLRFALATFAETVLAAMKEQMTQMALQIRHYLKWLAFTAAVLLVPLLGMTLRILLPHGTETIGINWGPVDFVAAGVLVLGSGLLYEYGRDRSVRLPHRLAVAIAVGAAFLLVWANLAVGLIGRSGSPANLAYLAVLAVAIGGAASSRFEPRRSSDAMVAAALLQAVISVIAMVAGLSATPVADLFFITLWVASAVLFRQASLGPGNAAKLTGR
jgi:hypothetical protein